MSYHQRFIYIKRNFSQVCKPWESRGKKEVTLSITIRQSKSCATQLIQAAVTFIHSCKVSRKVYSYCFPAYFTIPIIIIIRSSNNNNNNNNRSSSSIKSITLNSCAYYTVHTQWKSNDMNFTGQKISIPGIFKAVNIIQRKQYVKFSNPSRTNEYLLHAHQLSIFTEKLLFSTAIKKKSTIKYWERHYSGDFLVLKNSWVYKCMGLSL